MKTIALSLFIFTAVMSANAMESPPIYLSFQDDLDSFLSESLIDFKQEIRDDIRYRFAGESVYSAIGNDYQIIIQQLKKNRFDGLLRELLQFSALYDTKQDRSHRITLRINYLRDLRSKRQLWGKELAEYLNIHAKYLAFS